MNVQTAAREFTEKYPLEAVSTITTMSEDLSLQMSKFKGINFDEAVDNFTSYLKGYVEHRVTPQTESADKKSDQDILEHTKSFVREKLFQETEIPYTKAASFVESVLKHLVELPDSINKLQESLLSTGVSPNSVGCIVEMADDYVSCLMEQVTPIMDKLLWASGYNSAQKLAAAQPTKKEKDFIL